MECKLYDKEDDNASPTIVATACICVNDRIKKHPRRGNGVRAAANLPSLVAWAQDEIGEACSRLVRAEICAR